MESVQKIVTLCLAIGFGTFCALFLFERNELKQREDVNSWKQTKLDTLQAKLDTLQAKWDKEQAWVQQYKAWRKVWIAQHQGSVPIEAFSE